MSRVSLNKRLSVIRDALLPPGSFAHAVYHLPQREREQFEAWRVEHKRIIAAAQAEGGPGTAYQRLIDDEPLISGSLALGLPSLPSALGSYFPSLAAPSSDSPRQHWEKMLKE